MFLTEVFKIGAVDISQFFKIFCAVFVFLFALKNSGCHPSALLERIGRVDSLDIYLFHFLLIRLLRLCLENLSVPQAVTDWCLPVVVIVLSVLLAELIVLVKGRIHRSRA